MFNQESWGKLNISNFNYQDCSTCSNNIKLKYSNNNKGFLTDYSMSNPYEDMAEIYSFMKTNKKLLLKRLHDDQIIENKVNFLKNNISKINQNFEF